MVFLTMHALVGCGRGDRLYRVSGRVTFAGKPVPAGQIYFLPDSRLGNRGPAGYATIRDGAYDTHRSPTGRGVLGGPYQIRIEGHDGQPAPDAAEPPMDRIVETRSQMLFRDYLVTADFDEADSVRDFDVPLPAGAKATSR